MSSLSIISICQDEAEVIGWFLECCLHTDSILGDLLKEIVIVDGGSKDNTVSIIQQYQKKCPKIQLHEHPFDSFGSQKNRALEHTTGDYIFAPDTDMTWTMNFPTVFKSGYYESANLWDFRMLFTADDGYHYFNWTLGVNMRLWKSGFKFVTGFHEKLDGQIHAGGLPVCQHVWLFENSFRQSDEALWNRGRRYQKFTKQMTEAGGGPGSEDRYINAKLHTPSSQKLEIPQIIKDMILPITVYPMRYENTI